MLDRMALALRCTVFRPRGHPRRRLRRQRPSTVRSARLPRGSALPTAASAACRPVNGSAIASPQNTGSSSVPPTRPPDTAASSPNATQLACSPSAPWPVIRSQTRPSRGAMSVGPRPRCASAAGRDDSMTTSAASSSRRQAGWFVEIDRVRELSAVHPVEERRRPRAGAVGPSAGFDLDDGGACPREQLSAQGAGPHRGQVGDQEGCDGSRGAAAAPSVVIRDGAGRVSPRAATGRPSRRARAVTSAEVLPATQRLNGRPRIVADRVGLEQRGYGVDVVLSRQRERAPTVAAAHQPGGSARRDPAVR